MAWELATTTIEAGESQRWWLHWPNYPGIQVFQARSVPTERGGLRLEIGAVLQISDISFEFQSSVDGYFYYLTVTHVGGWSPATYRLTGAKVS